MPKKLGASCAQWSGSPNLRFTKPVPGALDALLQKGSRVIVRVMVGRVG